MPRTHDAHAHGDDHAAGACARADFRKLLSQHVELYEALLRLQLPAPAPAVRRGRGPQHPAAARRAWPSRSCCWRAATASQQGDEIRIGLQLAQEDIAQLLGASRQRVNQELKGFEREGAVRIEPTRLVVLSKDKLLAIAPSARSSGRSDCEAQASDSNRPMSTPEANHRHQAGRRAARLRHAPRSSSLSARRTCAGFAGPADGRAVQGRPVESDLQARHARRAAT